MSIITHLIGVWRIIGWFYPEITFAPASISWNFVVKTRNTKWIFGTAVKYVF